MLEILSIVAIGIAFFSKPNFYRSAFSFAGLIAAIFALKDMSSSGMQLFYATSIVFLFWILQSIRFSFSRVRTLVTLTLGLGCALFLFQGLFPSFGASAMTGKWKGFDLNPGSIASLQTSHEKAIELYMDHTPTRDERYFRVGALSETNNGLDYRVGARRPLKTDLFPETKAWASSHLAGKNLQEDIHAVESWWSSNFLYSLNPGTMQGSYPLDQFLFEKKIGFCEHYAAAMSTLLKIARYDARVAVGFSGGVWNPLSRKLTYEMSDAHAWVEVFDSIDNHWIRVDPTLWVRVEETRLRSNYEGLLFGALLVGLILLAGFLFRNRKLDSVIAMFQKIEKLEGRFELEARGLTLKERIERLGKQIPMYRSEFEQILQAYQNIRFEKNPRAQNERVIRQSLKKLRWSKISL